MTAQDTRALRKALEPFANLGSAYVKHGPGDNSPFADAADTDRLFFGGLRDGPWHVTVGQLRAASVAYDAADKVTVWWFVSAVTEWALKTIGLATIMVAVVVWLGGK